jgi:hypothetical protein
VTEHKVITVNSTALNKSTVAVNTIYYIRLNGKDFTTRQMTHIFAGRFVFCLTNWSALKAGVQKRLHETLDSIDHCLGSDGALASSVT